MSRIFYRRAGNLGPTDCLKNKNKMIYIKFYTTFCNHNIKYYQDLNGNSSREKRY
jgi:hypothetical protein